MSCAQQKGIKVLYPNENDDDPESPYQDEPDWDEGDFNDLIDDPNRESEFPETD